MTSIKHEFLAVAKRVVQRRLFALPTRLAYHDTYNHILRGNKPSDIRNEVRAK